MLEPRKLLSGSVPTLTSVATITGATEDVAFPISYATIKTRSDVADSENDAIQFRIEAVSGGTLKKGSTVVVPGTTTISSTDTLTWTPTANASGVTNAFTIKAYDGTGYSTTAVQVKVDLAPVNDAPTIGSVTTLTGATEDTGFSIPYSTLLASAVGANDVDGDTLSFQVATISSGSLKINGITVVPGDANRNKLNPGDTWVWTPNPNANGVGASALNAFMVKVYDGTTTSATAVQVKVAVAAVNDAPSLTSVNTLTGASEDNAYTITYAALVAASNISDPDGGSPQFRIQSVTSNGTLLKGGSAVTAGTTTLGTGETLTWTPSANTNGTMPAFTVVAYDGTLASANALTVNVAVAAVNDAPVLSAVDTFTGALEDTPYEITYDALIGASDVSDIDSTTISFKVTSTTTGTLMDANGNAIVSGTALIGPGGKVLWQPAANANGTVNAFVVKANDGTSDSSAGQTVQVTVIAVPDAPALTAVSTLTGGAEDTAYNITFAAFNTAAIKSDADGDTISYRIESVTSGTLTKSGTPVTPGVTLFQTGDTLVWTPDANANGTAVSAFTVRATDGTLLSSTPIQVKVAVAAANDVPTMTNLTPLGGATEDTAFAISYATLKAATDVGDMDGDTIQFRVESVAAGTLKKNNVAVVAGTTLVTTNDTLTWTPAANTNGVIDAFTVKAWDGVAASATALTVKVAVTAVNDAPTLTQLANISGATEDAPFNVTWAMLNTAAGANVGDVDSSTINYVVTTLGTGTLTRNGIPVQANEVIASGDTLVWTPAANANGTATNAITAFSVKATDGALQSSLAIPVKVNVANVNDAPTLSTVNNLTGATEDAAYTITYANLAAASNAADIEGPVQFRIESLTAGTLTKGGTPVVPGTTTLATGETLVWTPAANVNGAGVAAFTVKAWDTVAASANAVQVKVNVNAVNDVPTMTTIANLTGGTEDTPYTITYSNLLAASNAQDVESPITFIISTVTAGTLTKNGSAVTPNATFTANDTLTWTPAANVNGTGVAAFTVKANDGTATTATAIPVKVNLAAVNDSPTLTSANNLTGGTEDAPLVITYAQLKSATNVQDTENDTISFRIEGVSTGTLTKGVTAVTPGTTTIAVGESLTWTPALNAYGTAFNALPAFTVKAYDGNSYSAAPVTIKVDTANVNDAPTLTTITAFADPDQATEDTAYNFTYDAIAAAADEADIDNATIQFRVDAVSTGTLKKNGVAVTPGTTTLGPGEVLTWTPAANANGTAVNAFTLKAWDGVAASTTGIQVAIDVDAVNDAPTFSTVATLAGATEDTQLNIAYADLVTNASDAEGDAIVYRIEAISSGTLTIGGAPVTAGTTTFTSSDTLEWTPDTDANGTLNAFTITAGDGTDFSATPIQVKVTVAAVNDATPAFSGSGALAGTEDTAMTITYGDLLTLSGMTDADPEQTLQFRVSSIDGGTITKNGVAITTGAAGTLLSSGDSIVYTPAANASGNATHAFVLLGYDGVANSGSTFQVDVDLTAVNDAPTLTAVTTLTGGTEDTPLTIAFADLTATVNDADGDTISYRIESVVNGTLTIGGVAVVPGTTMFTSSDSLEWTPSADANGTIGAFKIVASDGTLFSATPITVSVTVAADTDNPTLTSIATFTKGLENTPLVISYADLLAASDLRDPDGGTVTFRIESITSGTLTKGASNTAIVDGTTTLGVGEFLTWTPATNASGSAIAAFEVVGFDGTNDSGTPVSVAVDVAHIAQMPTLGSVTGLTGATEDTAFNIDFADLVTDAADPESGAISYRIESVTSGTLTKGGVAVVPGVTTFGTGETLVWTPAADANGSALAAFKVRAKTAAGISTTAPVTVTVDVAAANDLPTLTAITPFETGEDVQKIFTYASLLAASDAKDLDGDSLVFTVEESTSGTLTKGGVAVVDGTTTLGPGETLEWTPATDASGAGIVAFKVTANDGTGASATQVSVKVNVAPINDAPTFTAVTDLTGATAGVAFNITYADITGAGNQADAEGGTINFVVGSVLSGTLTKNGVLVIPGVTRIKAGDTLVWTSAAGASGSTAAFTLFATDGQSMSASAVTVNVDVT